MDKRTKLKTTKGGNQGATRCFMCREPFEPGYQYMFCQACLGRPRKLNMGLPNTTRESEYKGNEPFTPAQ